MHSRSAQGIEYFFFSSCIALSDVDCGGTPDPLSTTAAIALTASSKASRKQFHFSTFSQKASCKESRALRPNTDTDNNNNHNKAHNNNNDDDDADDDHSAAC